MTPARQEQYIPLSQVYLRDRKDQPGKRTPEILGQALDFTKNFIPFGNVLYPIAHTIDIGVYDITKWKQGDVRIPRKAQQLSPEDKQTFLRDVFEYNEDRANREAKKPYHDEKRNILFAGAMVNGLTAAAAVGALLLFPEQTAQVAGFIAEHLPSALPINAETLTYGGAAISGVIGLGKVEAGVREWQEKSIIGSRAGDSLGYSANQAAEDTRQIANLKARVTKAVEYIGIDQALREQTIEAITTETWALRTSRRPEFSKLGESEKKTIDSTARQLARLDLFKDAGLTTRALLYRAQALTEGYINLEDKRKQLRAQSISFNDGAQESAEPGFVGYMRGGSTASSRRYRSS